MPDSLHALNRRALAAEAARFLALDPKTARSVIDEALDAAPAGISALELTPPGRRPVRIAVDSGSVTFAVVHPAPPPPPPHGITIADVKRLAVAPGDVVVVRLDEKPNPATSEAILSNLTAAFPKNTVVVLGPGEELQAVTPPAPAPPPTPPPAVTR